MKRIFANILLLFIFGIGLISNAPVYAENTSNQTVILSKTETINQDYFAAGDTVRLSGTVNGDAYIAGGNVTFDGIVNGDLITAGGNITILGKVTGNVRAAGGNIVFSSSVDKNATIIGGTISLSDSGKIGGSLVSAGGNITVNSPIGKGAHLAGGQIILENSIGSSVYTYTSDLTLTPQTKINGDLNYWSEQKLIFNPEASISGQTNYHYQPTSSGNRSNDIANGQALFGLVTTGALIFSVYSLIVSLIIGLLLIKLLPVFTEETIKTLTKHPWASLGVGFLVTLLFPMTFILLLVTVIGIPLALALVVSMILLWFFSKTIIALFIGSKILNYTQTWKNTPIWNLLMGLIILEVLAVIPFINVLSSVLVYLFGIGSLLIQQKNSYFLLRKKELI